MSSVLNVTINVVFSLVSTFLKILLAPIDSLIMNFLPDVSSLCERLTTFLDLCCSSIGWVIDALGIPSGVLVLMGSYFMLKYTIYLFTILIKITIGWVGKFI